MFLLAGVARLPNYWPCALLLLSVFVFVCFFVSVSRRRALVELLEEAEAMQAMQRAEELQAEAEAEAGPLTDGDPGPDAEVRQAVLENTTGEASFCQASDPDPSESKTDQPADLDERPSADVDGTSQSEPSQPVLLDTGQERLPERLLIAKPTVGKPQDESPTEKVSERLPVERPPDRDALGAPPADNLLAATLPDVVLPGEEGKDLPIAAGGAHLSWQLAVRACFKSHEMLRSRDIESLKPAAL